MDTHPRDLGDGNYRVRTSTLIAILGDPFEECVWACRPINLEEVYACPEDAQRAEVGSSPENIGRLMSDRDFHIGRVAYLMHHGWDENAHVPTVEFSVDYWGDPSGDAPSLLDGNHRFAAAIARGDEYFTVAVDGDIDAAERAFGI
jgi:hypothetical protein